MSKQVAQILKEALDLPPVQRAELVESILASFDFPARRQIDELWAKDAESRIDAYDRGETEVIAMQSNPQFMAHLAEPVERARKGPHKSLARVRKELAAGP